MNTTKAYFGWVPTFTNKDGLRVMAVHNNNNPSYPTKEECDNWLQAMLANTSAETIKSIWGENPRFESTLTELHTEQGDSVRTVFN